MAKVHFGVTLPQIKRPWADTAAAARALDELGFDSVWFNDHLYGVPMPNLPILEAWTALAAVGALTSRVELGTLVTPVGFRNPALLAKMAATLDVVTNGRAIVGLGSGWFQSEFEGYGMPFPPLRDRLEQLDETATILKLLWTEAQPSFAGKHYRLDATYCEPKPVRRPPILIGGGGEKVLLRLAARHADVWNNLAVHQNDLGAKVAKLREHCAAVGRDPAAIRVSQQCLVVIGDDEADARAKSAKAAAIYGGHMGAGGPLAIAGTAEQCIERIEAHVALGCTMMVMEFFGRDVREPARLFAERVLPRFR
ncbi:MAG: TIGR03560 family F420-dependent LLM class oxidoreductase [Deltaproteobacteria bacterium]|nr:TIGR03560 family F420-dependent LLM class oxidoreductase [Deltaproteobacteria bacterium]